MIKEEIEKYIKQVFPDAKVFDKQLDPASADIGIQVTRGEDIFVSVRTYLYRDVRNNKHYMASLAMNLTRAMCCSLIGKVE